MPTESPEFAAILAEMKGLKKGLTEQLKELSRKVDGVGGDVRDLRSVCRELFEAVLNQEVELTKVKARQDTFEAELTLLKNRVNGSASSPSEHS